MPNVDPLTLVEQGTVYHKLLINPLEVTLNELCSDEQEDYLLEIVSIPEIINNIPDGLESIIIPGESEFMYWLDKCSYESGEQYPTIYCIKDKEDIISKPRCYRLSKCTDHYGINFHILVIPPGECNYIFPKSEIEKLKNILRKYTGYGKFFK